LLEPISETETTGSPYQPSMDIAALTQLIDEMFDAQKITQSDKKFLLAEADLYQTAATEASWAVANEQLAAAL